MTTPPPIFDADELRRLADACPDSMQGYCNGCGQGVGSCGCSARYKFRYATTKSVVLALLDERATLLARVEAAEAAAREHWRTVCDLRRRLADETGEGLP